MANNVIADPGAGGATFKTTDNAGVHTPHSNIDNTVTVTGTVTASGPLTDTQLRATPVPVSGTVAVTVPAPLSTTGGGTEATALRVTVANDSTGVLSVDDNGGSLTVDGSVTANAGTNLNTSTLALEAGGNLAAAAASLSVMDDWDESDRAKVNLIAGQAGVQGASGTVTALTQRVVLATDVALPAGTNNIGDIDVLTVPADPFGVNADAASINGSISAKLRSMATKLNDLQINASGNLRVQTQRASTGTTSTVADSATSVTLLSSDANRLGATIANDSSAALFVKFGTTATLTDYTVKVITGAYYEVPFGYTGRIDGIWATDPGDGAARITDFS